MWNLWCTWPVVSAQMSYISIMYTHIMYNNNILIHLCLYLSIFISIYCCSDVFLPQNYVPRLARCVLECLQRAHDLIADSKDCSLEFVSRLVGKFCFTGSAGVVVILWFCLLILPCLHGLMKKVSDTVKLICKIIVFEFWQTCWMKKVIRQGETWMWW